MDSKFFIGVDISKITLDFVVSSQTEIVFHLQVSNNKEGISSFISRCKKEKICLAKTLICMEHTGIYNNAVLDFFLKKKK